MTLVTSNMLPLGTRAPDFRLPDTRTDKLVSLEESKSNIATVILFLCNHCPFVKHIQKKLVEVVNEYQTKGIKFIAISSNDVKTYPQDSPELMRKEAEEFNYTFPYLFDETQSVAKAYQAACTPDIYIFDKNLQCVYRGRFDASTPRNNEPVTGADLTEALDNILQGKPVNADQKVSMGCNIKWR